MTSECVDNNYLKDTCHLPTIILHLSSEKIVQKKIRKCFQSSRSRSRKTCSIGEDPGISRKREIHLCRECHNGTCERRNESKIVQTTKGAKIRSGGKGCENQTLSFFYINPPCVARAVIKNKFKNKTSLQCV